MADETSLPQLPVAATADTSQALPPLAPAPVAPALNAPTPPSPNDQALPSLMPAATAGPPSARTAGILDDLKQQVIDPAVKMVTGKGTMFGTEDAGPKIRIDKTGVSLRDSKTDEPISAGEAWRQLKIAGHNFLDTSLIVPYNGVTPEEAAARPKEAAAAQGLSNAVKGLTTPGNLALIIGTWGLGEFPALLEETLGGLESTAPYAAKAAKVAKATISGLSVYFTADQIAKTIEAVPEVMQAIMTGQTTKAIELTTSAMVNGIVAGTAARETYRTIHGGADPLVEKGAMKHDNYAEMVHDRQQALQVAGGQKSQIADLGRDVAPDAKDREWATEYVEANKDRKLLADRQKQTAAGPKPAEALNPNDYYYHAVDKSRLPSIEQDGLKAPWLAKSPEEALRSGVAPISGNKADLTVLAIPRDQVTPGTPDAADIGARDVEKGKYVKSNDVHKNFVQVDQTGVPVKVVREQTQAAPTAAEVSQPASQHALELQAAVHDAEEAAKAHIITPEERAKMAEQQDPARPLSSKLEKAIDFVTKQMDTIKGEAQKRGLLPKGQLRIKLRSARVRL